MKLSFHGAAQGVTGSCHLLQCAGKRILVDCGFYQGGRELEEDNADEFGFDAASIDYLLLTHAHLDHCGRIPLLVSRGFQGEIITTAAKLTGAAHAGRRWGLASSTANSAAMAMRARLVGRLYCRQAK